VVGGNILELAGAQAITVIGSGIDGIPQTFGKSLQLGGIVVRLRRNARIQWPNAVGIPGDNELIPGLIHDNNGEDAIEGPEHGAQGHVELEKTIVQATKNLAIGPGLHLEPVLAGEGSPVIDLSVANPGNAGLLHGLHALVIQAIDRETRKSESGAADISETALFRAPGFQMLQTME